MDVADWLRALGLECYEAAFRENDVNAEVLRDLTAEDLEGLGVIGVGYSWQSPPYAPKATRPVIPSGFRPAR